MEGNLLAALIAAADSETSNSNWWLIIIGVIQSIIFALQLIVFGYQARKLRQTVDASAQQTRDMKESIAQATRAATAMEGFAESAAVSAKAATDSVATVKDAMSRQLRAYLCVNFYLAIPQNLEDNYRFVVRLHLIFRWLFRRDIETFCRSFFYLGSLFLRIEFIYICGENYILPGSQCAFAGSHCINWQ
jgi:hypothetical protein